MFGNVSNTGRLHTAHLLVEGDATQTQCYPQTPCIKGWLSIHTSPGWQKLSLISWLPFCEFKTITSDNGSEFAQHVAIAALTGASFYFARPYHSWERGLNEHTNGLIRRFYPKGTDFNQVSDEDIAILEHILNTRGRASLGLQVSEQCLVRVPACSINNRTMCISFGGGPCSCVFLISFAIKQEKMA
jgi:hypothetical protein